MVKTVVWQGLRRNEGDVKLESYNTHYTTWYGKGRAQNWRTPPELFSRLHTRYNFTLDGAADDGNALLPKASTPTKPLSWTGERVFCNPPWSDIASFIALAPHAELAVLLVPARPNARWFHNALASGARVDFFIGRPKFINPLKEKSGSSPVDCLLLIWGDEDVEKQEIEYEPTYEDVHGLLTELAKIEDDRYPPGKGEGRTKLAQFVWEATMHGEPYEKLRENHKIPILGNRYKYEKKQTTKIVGGKKRVVWVFYKKSER